MTDYYEELNIDRSASISDINKTLSQLERIWINRNVNNPEKATTMLALIIQARKVFASEESRREYDRSLAKSKEKPAVTDPNEARNQQFKKWSDEARSYFENKQYDLAKTAVDSALSYYDPSTEDDIFFSLVADIYKMNRDYSIALDYINKAIVINPQEAMHYILKAGIFEGQASQSQGYRSAEVGMLIQNVRDTLNQAANVANRQNDRNAESAAYGLLAANYYFASPANSYLAENYARESAELGNVWGNASKVLDAINRKRQQEAIAAEEQKRQAEERKRQQEQLAKEEREREERKIQAELEGKKRENQYKILYAIGWLAFLGSILYIVLPVLRNWPTDWNAPIDVAQIDFRLISIVAIAGVALMYFGCGCANRYLGAVISFVWSFIYCVAMTSIKSAQVRNLGETWKFFGILVGCFLVAMVVAGSLSKRMRRGLDE